MRVNREKLISILSAIKPALAKSGIVEGGNNYIFTGDEVITFNDQIAISHPYKSDFDCCVPADELYKIISNIDKNAFTMEQKEDKMLINAKGLKAKISTIDMDTKDLIDLIKPSSVEIEWIRLPEQFIKAVKLCLFSTSKDMSRPAYTCLSINHDHVASTDNFRLSHFKLKETMEHSFLLPASAASELIKFNVSWYYLSESWIYFNTDDDVIFCSRIGEGEFPEFAHLLKVKSKKISLPDKLKKSIDVSSIMTSGDFAIDKKIQVTIKDEKISCKGENELGFIETSLPIETSEDIHFAINPMFFSEIIDRATTVMHDENKILFRAGSFRHLMSVKK